ncbi:MAG TPA: hypothetical protein VFS43_37560 [Polyangiaceae bacterium]|nr:hypothetical protein [Polyangiaceae bacterium]
MMTPPTFLALDGISPAQPAEGPSAAELARRARAADLEAGGHLSDELVRRAGRRGAPAPSAEGAAAANVVSLDAFRAVQRARATSMRAISSFAAVTTTSKR